MSIENNQDDHKYYRNLIYNYINVNKDILQVFFPENDEENETKFKERYKSFINEINKEGTYAWDFELSSACLALNKKIIVFSNQIEYYAYINEYSNHLNDSIEATEDNRIFLLFKNNNHFNLLISKNNDNNMDIVNKEKSENIHEIIENRITNIKISDIKK